MQVRRPAPSYVTALARWGSGRCCVVTSAERNSFGALKHTVSRPQRRSETTRGEEHSLRMARDSTPRKDVSQQRTCVEQT